MLFLKKNFRSEKSKQNFSISFEIPINALSFKQIQKQNPETLIPQTFWPFFKKIRYSKKWFEYEDGLLTSPEKMFDLLKIKWGFLEIWNVEEKNNEFFGTFLLDDIQIYFHFEFKYLKRKMKFLVAYLHKEYSKWDLLENNSTLLDHVYDSLFYILKKTMI